MQLARTITLAAFTLLVDATLAHQASARTASTSSTPAPRSTSAQPTEAACCKPARRADHVSQPVPYCYDAAEITRICDARLARAAAEIDAIAKIPDAQRTFTNTVAAFEACQARLADALNPLELAAEVYSDTKVQAAAGEAGDKASAFDARTWARPELYRAMQAVADHHPLKGEEARLLQEILKGFRRSGAALPEAERKELTTLRDELTKAQTQFSRTLAQANDTVELSIADLDGLPPSFIGSLKRSEKGGYLLTLLDASQYIPFMENARSGDARHKVLAAKDRVAASTNVALLEKAIRLRHRIATLMGFPNHAAYVLDNRMAKSPERVRTFLGDLAGRLVPKARAEMATLLELKKQDDPQATRIEAWDISYYLNQLKKARYSVDNEAVRAYFPVDRVIQGVFETYQKLLGVHFTEVDASLLGKPWADGLRLFEVRDTAGQHRLAYFYLDLYPRPNKYKHFAAFTIRSGHSNPDGSYTAPVAAIVGNFPAPSNDKPALLRHNEVETFFHEFGHIMHKTLTQAGYAKLAGSAVRRDFVEAPSQMLENWVWDRSILARVSAHYKTGEPLPSALLDKMLAARHAGDGLMYTRQLMFATVDLAFHTSGEQVDTTQVWHKARRELTLVEPDADSQPQATFGHLMGGYDAGYYGYLWSKVYAEDMFTVFEKLGLTSPQAGGRYRSCILAKGNTADPDVLLRAFLGRPPRPEAFYKSLGL